MIISLSVSAKKPAVPNSVQYVLEQAKGRLVFAESGRYVFKTRQGDFALARFKDETKFSPSMNVKMFSNKMVSKSEDFNVSTEAYSEPEDELQAEAAAKAPGAKNKAASTKMGVKKRAPGMMAPGWWLFHKDEGKVTRQYVGPRLSGRKLLSLVKPELPSNNGKPDTKETKHSIGDNTPVKVSKVSELYVPTKDPVNDAIKVWKALDKKLESEGIPTKETLAVVDAAISKMQKMHDVLTSPENKSKHLGDSIELNYYLKDLKSIRSEMAKKPKLDEADKKTLALFMKAKDDGHGNIQVNFGEEAKAKAAKTLMSSLGILAYTTGMNRRYVNIGKPGHKKLKAIMKQLS
jgi:hypothetical protein